MSLDHAILGFLNYSSLSGYDLKKTFDVSVRHFWPADQSQIYRTLTRLTVNGWVEMSIVEQSERPDRKVYHITESGRAELRRWLTSEIPAPENRVASLIQVFFAAQLADEEVLALFERAAKQTQATLAQYQKVPEGFEAEMSEIKTPREAFFWMLTLESGRRAAQARLEWIQDVIRRIHNGEAPAE